MLSLLKAVGTILPHLFRRRDTVLFPEERPYLPPRYRGRIVLTRDPSGGERCVACYLCAVACPVDCIKIESVKGPKSTVKSLREEKESPKTRYATQFDIHLGRCMYCGLCVEACPQGGIYFSREFRGATEDYGQLIRHFIPRDEAERLKKMAAEEAAKPKEPKPEKKAEATSGAMEKKE